jgi:hypothetical protein
MTTYSLTKGSGPGGLCLVAVGLGIVKLLLISTAIAPTVELMRGLV